MALPHIIKHIYKNGTDEVIRRGKKIHALGLAQMTEHDELLNMVVMRVRDDLYNTYYKVHIQKYSDPRLMTLRCGCPYNLGEICRHEAAGLFLLQDLIDRNQLNVAEIVYDQHHTIAKMGHIDLRVLRMLSSRNIMDTAEHLLRTNKVNIISAENERVEANVTIDEKLFPLVIQKNDERVFDTSCTCSETNHPLCLHKAMTFLQLLNSFGPHYFDTIRNWDKEKDKLLQIYGYSLNDDLEGKFLFTYKEGKPFLKVLDPSIKRVAHVVSNSKPRPLFNSAQPTPLVESAPVEVASYPHRLGLVFNFNSKTFPFFTVALVLGEPNDSGTGLLGKAEAVDVSKFVQMDSLPEEDRLLLQCVRKLQDNEINKYLNRNSPFSGIWDNIIHTEGDDFPDETKAIITEYVYPRLKKIFTGESRDYFVYQLPLGKVFKTAMLEEIELGSESVSPVFYVSARSGQLELTCKVNINGQWVDYAENECGSPLLLMIDKTIYLWKLAEDAMEVQRIMKSHKTKFGKKELLEIIMPLAKQYRVEFDKSLLREVKVVHPDMRINLMEKGDYLVLQPVFSYNGFEARSHDKETLIIPDGDKIIQIKRNGDTEQAFLQKLETLHSQFSRQADGGFALKGSDVLKNNWFFLFMDAMKELKVPVYGFDSLKNFRFNTSRPKTLIHMSSGVDWFDAKVEIDFGEQRVGISEIKRALSSQQSFVQLGDGSLGILPEEWIKKYALLFKVAEGNSNQLRLSKYHLSVIDELYENRNEEELSFALDEKFEKLRSFKSIPQVDAPAALAPVLRPYQLSGYQWLSYLQDVGWGGILADDMGLGKTVQALAMLQQFKLQHNKLLTLVVCPTTLIYNWQNEVKKFTSGLTCHIHHGNTRSRDIQFLTQHNIIITTYGTLRSDINLFLKFNFDYVVLDESQAIKNPSSKVTKAATLLNGTNRLCLSGTPLQNNTFDIYAQMNFLNPGLLGSVEYFRNEFANPIDKFQEQEHKEHLRKLLLPFILRRTKEQVAKDLPEKTETILFCEMGAEQRRIYNAYRNSYREKIIGVIDEQGIDKSQLTILQGLMKLRQICDSPAILNEEEKFPNHSIKLEELTREITENIGEHKALVFSQFLGMLGLIRKKLEEMGIKYVYFDGSTSTTEREKAIQAFQQDDSIRVFLISLKAGGVGLNLTAADYVYIVDPWWNPAVEQQAIDRTHRIGQTKNIFAYRMICLETIEDKILQLQEKKRVLAKELISDESGFVKTLTRADVEYLFS